MGVLLDEYARLEQARLLVRARDSVAQHLIEIKQWMDEMGSAKIKYPEHADEIDELIALGKTALTNLANQY